MKILVLDLCNYVDYPLGGQLSFVKNLITAFGADAKLVGVSTDGLNPVGQWSKKNISGIDYEFYSVASVKKTFKKPLVPQRIKSIFQLKPHIKNILNSEVEYDLIFVQAPELLFCMSDEALAKTFMIMPGVENPLSISRYPIARKFQKLYDYLFMKKARKVKYIFASADEKEIINFIRRSKHTISRSQIIKYPTRYNSDIYNYKDRQAMRSELKIPSDITMITTVGRLAWFKGWKFMIDSFALYLETTPQAKFYFLGDGEDRPQIEAYIQNKNLTDKIVLAGSVPPQMVAKYLNASDVFVMGSYKEGWSTTLVEACACCVPCVITDFSSAEEMIKDGINGYVQKSRSEEEFAQKVKDAVNMDRSAIVDYNSQYKSLAVCEMRASIESVIDIY